jgi:hypothetical protein
MIHLKRFNEKIQWNRDRPELLKFCEEYLAYLLDEGFDVSVRLYEKENRLYRDGIRDEGYISIQSKNNTFKWNDVKEDFIPFLEMLVIKYDLVERLVEYGNTVIDKYETGAPALKAAYKMQVLGNTTSYNADVKSSFPTEVLFPDATMGVYGDLAPDYSLIVGKPLAAPPLIDISRILLGTNYLKETYMKFTDEQTANIPFKNITKFFEETTKRINYATGDIYQITPTLVENPRSFDASVGGFDQALLSIEDSNLAPEHTAFIPLNFDASIFRPIMRNVSITCKPPSAMATAAYVQQRGGGVSNVEVQAGKPKGADKVAEAKTDMTKATENFTATGFNNAWCEAFRGNLQKYKKGGGAGGSNSHWLNQALYPINLSITIDGVAGFTFGDAIQTSLVPRRYFGKVSFVITKIDHKITSAAWETILNTTCRIKPEANL